MQEPEHRPGRTERYCGWSRGPSGATEKIGIGSGRCGVGREMRLLPGVWIWSCFVGVKMGGEKDGSAVVAWMDDEVDADDERLAVSMSLATGLASSCSLYEGSAGSVRETS